MSLADAFAPAEAEYREQVLQHTFGHLAPDAGRVYRGDIWFAIGDYGDMVPLRADLEGLDDSPWFFEAMMEDLIWQSQMESGVYRWTGSYRSFKNGRHVFHGTVTSVPIGFKED